MKTTFSLRTLATVFIAAAFAMTFTSCSDDDDKDNIVTPLISIDEDAPVVSFELNNATYKVILANKSALQTGINSVQAVLEDANGSSISGYEIDIDPRMPDMKNHSSANNKNLEWDDTTKAYIGTLNLSMTGLWRINLIIRDANGNVVAGTEVTDESPKSTIYWDIQI